MTNLHSENSQRIPSLTTLYSPLNLIKAGAGAGKTYHIQKTLTEWVKSGEVKADRILAVTFTNSAANELKERIRLALLQGGLHQESTNIQHSKISTIHGFGLELLERFAYETGSSPSPRQLTEAEQNILIRLSLAKVHKIIPILDDLSGWGYKDGFKGAEYKEAVVKFKDLILNIIGILRNLSSIYDVSQTLALIKRAKENVEEIYGKNLSKADTLNNALWEAIKSVQDKFSGNDGKSVLEVEWASNPETRSFVSAIFRATQAEIESNWSLWKELQTIETAPNIFNKKTNEANHDDAKMAFDIWAAADKLSVHPGPLEQSLAHIEILLDSALEALNHYQILKNEAGLVDFGDMVHLAEQLMNDKRYLDEIKSNFDCLIIDEFQDTNPLQFSLLWSIAKAGIPALIVGDVKQSIMGFQGADSRLFNMLVEKNPKYTAELACNWRSTEGVMAFINKLGKRLYEDEYSPLISQSKIKSSLRPVKIIDFPNDAWSPKGSAKKNLQSFTAEHDNVVIAEIKNTLASGVQVTDKITGQKRSIQPNDIAVLGPKNKRLAKFADKLREFGLQSQLKQKGWIESDSISWMLYALSYVADPRDQHALMCLNLMMNHDTDLETALKNYLSLEKPRKIKGKIATKLDSIRQKNKYSSITEVLSQTIDALSLWDRFAHNKSVEYGQQQRANLLKLVKLGETFETTQPETLQAQGVFGAGLSSFLVWLKLNSEDIDSQPHVDSINQNAIVLSTWHSSKGLEWPIVVIIGMEQVRDSKLPDVSVQYSNTENIDVMLEHSYAQILTNFDDNKTKEKFINNLQKSELNTLKNLTYVSMTRAREQLILPWFDPQKENCMIDLLSKSDFENPEVIIARVPEEQVVKNISESNTVKNGRSAIEYRAIPNVIAGQLSPTTLLKLNTSIDEIPLDESKISTQTYCSSPIDFSKLDEVNQANDIGTWIHQIYEVMLTKPKLKTRLFEHIVAFKQLPELSQLLVDHVQSFHTYLISTLEATVIKSEVPILAMTKEGATFNGIIDLLVETKDGYWIIDHKTDANMSFEQLRKHLPQILSYAEHLKLGKPILGVAINWVRAGKMNCLSF